MPRSRSSRVRSSSFEQSRRKSARFQSWAEPLKNWCPTGTDRSAPLQDLPCWVMPRLTLHTRFVNFTCWIRPDPDKVEEIRKQRDDVKARIKAKAEADGVIVRSMPVSGSFAKATGLRRHMLGDAEHEGQDVDCPFVVAGKDKDGDPLTELLSKFEGYAKACYSDTPVERTK